MAVRLSTVLADTGEEAALWERLRLHLPAPAAELHAQRERLRFLRTDVAAVVRGYNKVRKLT